MAALSDRRRVVPAADADAQPLPESVPNNNRENPRRVAGKKVQRPRLARQRSLTKDFEHVATETYMITRLTFTLLQYLG